MLQAVQHDVLAHPVGEVGVDHAQDRHVRQAVVAHQVIDARAEREDRREVGQARERAGRMLPRHGVVHGAAVEGLAERHDLPAGQFAPEAGDPGVDVPVA